MKIMHREGTLPNFEKMELVLIGEFHYFNMLFCKEDLMLSDHKTAILMNILWMLLINDNPGYDAAKDDVGAKFNAKDIDPNLLQRKNLDDDIIMFKDLLLTHSTGPSEEEVKRIQGHDRYPTKVEHMRVFEPSQVKQIVEYAYINYIDKFNLYKYVFENKKKNEEVQ